MLKAPDSEDDLRNEALALLKIMKLAERDICNSNTLSIEETLIQLQQQLLQ